MNQTAWMGFDSLRYHTIWLTGWPLLILMGVFVKFQKLEVFSPSVSIYLINYLHMSPAPNGIGRIDDKCGRLQDTPQQGLHDHLHLHFSLNTLYCHIGGWKGGVYAVCCFFLLEAACFNTVCHL